MGIVEELLSRIKVNAAGCFEWQGHRDGKGYGKIQLNRRRCFAHRLSFEIFRRAIPSGLYVCHHCDNPCCINPSHLFLGTPRDNAQDAVRKNRTLHGERNCKAKLTESQVVELVERYNAGDTAASIQQRYGITNSALQHILNGRCWTRVKLPTVTKRVSGGLKPEFAGENAHWAKITADDVVAIRSLWKSGHTQVSLAAKYGLAQTQVSRICLRHCWKHVP